MSIMSVEVQDDDVSIDAESSKTSSDRTTKVIPQIGHDPGSVAI